MTKTIRLIAAGVAVTAAALACRNTGLTLPDLLTGALLLCLMFLPVGWLLTRGIGEGIISSGERFALAWPVGYAVSCSLYYFLSLAKAAFLFPLLVVAATAAAIALPRREKAGGGPGTAGGHLAATAAWNWPLLALAGLCLLVATRWTAPFTKLSGGTAYAQTPDHLLHLSFYWEMLRGIPPAQLPTAAGLPFPPYHVFAFMPGVLLIRAGGLDPVTVYHSLTVLAHLALFITALYLAVRVRTGSAASASLSLMSVFFVFNGVELVFRSGLVWSKMTPLGFFLRNVSGAGGLIVWAAVLCLLFVHDRERARERPSGRALYTAAILAGLSYFFKAQLFLLFGGAFFAALALLWLRERDLRFLAAAGITLAVAALVFISWRAERQMAGLVLAPGLFARKFVYLALRKTPSPFLGRTLLAFFRSFPWGLGWVAATLLGLGRLVHFSPFVPWFLGSRLGKPRTMGVGDGVLCLFLLLCLPAALFLGDTGLYGTRGAQAFREAANALPFLAACIDAALMAAIAARFGRKGSSGLLAAFLAASVLAVTLPGSGARNFIPSKPVPLAGGSLGALRYLREKTSPGAVVAEAGTLYRTGGASRRIALYPFVSGLSGRRTLLAYYRREIDPKRDRARDLKVLAATGDRARAQAILDRYGVAYILESAARPLRFDKSGLALVYNGGDTRIYRYEKDR